MKHQTIILLGCHVHVVGRETSHSFRMVGYPFGPDFFASFNGIHMKCEYHDFLIMRWHLQCLWLENMDDEKTFLISNKREHGWWNDIFSRGECSGSRVPRGKPIRVTFRAKRRLNQRHMPYDVKSHFDLLNWSLWRTKTQVLRNTIMFAGIDICSFNSTYWSLLKHTP